MLVIVSHSVLYVQKGLDADPSVFLDPNELSPDGTISICGTSFSENEETFAYSLSTSGSDWVEIKVSRLRRHVSFQPVLHDWCNKGCSMCYPVCGMVHIKEPLLLIEKSSLCGGSGFPFSLSEWSLTICLTPYNRK